MQRRRPRRNDTAAFKAQVAIAAINGDQTLAQLAEQFDVHPNQITAWKAQLEGSAADVFGRGGAAAAEPGVDVKAMPNWTSSIPRWRAVRCRSTPNTWRCGAESQRPPS